MTVTAVDIANMALSVLDEAPIGSLEDNDKAARLCKLHYETTREAELSKHSWAFAIKTATLTGIDTDSDATGESLDWQFDLPADCLRLLPLTYDNTLTGVPISWELRDGKLYSDQESPRKVRYIANLTDPDDWNALFTEVMMAALSVKLALPLTHKTGMLQVAQQAYDRALEAALAVTPSNAPPPSTTPGGTASAATTATGERRWPPFTPPPTPSCVARFRRGCMRAPRWSFTAPDWPAA